MMLQFHVTIATNNNQTWLQTGCSRILGATVDAPQGNIRVIKKVKAIFMDKAHPLNHEYKLPPSGLCLTVPPANKNR